MLWFYITVYAVLLGAELNAQLEASETDFDARPAVPENPSGHSSPSETSPWAFPAWGNWD